MRRAVLLVMLAFACNGGGEKTEAKAAGGSGGGSSSPESVGAVKRGQAFPADAPPAQACQADADCTVAVDAPVGSDPCCNVTVTALPIAVRYLQFMEEWRKGHCAGVSCPPLSLPGAQPAPCGLKGRCNAGTCNHSCGLPPDGGPAPTP